MCLILDANAVGAVFRSESPVGRDVREWLQKGNGRLVAGGKLYAEMANNSKFKQWAKIAVADGRLRRFTQRQIEMEEESLPAEELRSDDSHVIALARISGARVLYSEDGDLRSDFKNGKLVRHPNGKLLPMGVNQNDQRRRSRLLKSRDLCRSRQR